MSDRYITDKSTGLQRETTPTERNQLATLRRWSAQLGMIDHQCPKYDPDKMCSISYSMRVSGIMEAKCDRCDRVLAAAKQIRGTIIEIFRRED